MVPSAYGAHHIHFIIQTLCVPLEIGCVFRSKRGKLENGKVEGRKMKFWKSIYCIACGAYG